MSSASRRPSAPANKATIRVLRYLQYEAHLNPAAQLLAKELRIALCNPDTPFPGMVPYIDRLVATGKDTPYNMQLWFGPYWEEGTKEMHHQCRLATLSVPWPPSPYVNAYVNFHVLGRPRPPSPQEQAELEGMINFSQNIAV